MQEIISKVYSIRQITCFKLNNKSKTELDFVLSLNQKIITIEVKASKKVNQNIKWPVWVVDIPESNSFIHTGQPICSIIADGKNEQQVFKNLQLRQQQLSKLLG